MVIMSAMTINMPATINVALIPVAMALGWALVMSVVIEADANIAPITDVPVMSPKLRDKLSIPEIIPRWLG